MTRFALVSSAAVLLASVLVLPHAVPLALKAVAPAVAALAAAIWSGIEGQRSAAATRADLGARLARAEALLSDHGKNGSQLRHDIRGYLSPALLTADRLSTNPDPIVRRAAETMIAAVERIEQRLRDA